MRIDTFRFKADDKKEIFVYRGQPDEGVEVRGVIHIAHGMAEHAARYARLAKELTAAGFVVYANDHRGHGKTAANEGELGFIASEKSFQRAVDDITELIAFEKGQHPGLPVVLFGHSMGSFISQAFLAESGWSLAGAVLSGSAGKPDILATAGKVIARIERARLGPKGKSKLLDKLSFEDFNKPFKPNRTRLDWLSRDNEEVDKYIADPLCGFICSTQVWVDLLDLLANNAKPSTRARVPKELPIYVFAGSEDPVGAQTKSVTELVRGYRAAGVRDVTVRYYPGGRHEMVNETNRDEVTRDLIAWLDAKIPRPAAKS